MTRIRTLSRCAVLALAVSCATAQRLDIQGAVNHQVLQRGADERTDLRLSGSTDAPNGRYIEGRILTKEGVLQGFDWRALDKVMKGRWQGEIKGIPTGGPYKLEVRVAGSPAVSTVDNLLVGDLWVLAGQSNMQGVGDLVDVPKPNELVHSFDMTDRWLTAEEPLHTLGNAADPVHWPPGPDKKPQKLEGDKLRDFVAERKKGAGVGLPFALEMLRRTGVPVGLVPCAHGGTSMDQWDPAKKAEGGNSLYGSMLRRFKAAGGKVRGVLWYQGEADANPKAAPAFAKKFETLVTSIREDFGQPDIPFYYVQIGRHINAANIAEWNAIQEAQRKSEPMIPRAGLVAAVDLELDDGIHVGTRDFRRLAARLANLACHDLFPADKKWVDLKRGPRPVSARAEGSSVRVLFAEVNGKLRSGGGRLSGFTIHGADGSAAPLIYKTRVDSQEGNSILLDFGGKLPEGAVLRYGAGKDPYCNLVDEADMAAPVFGPMPIEAN